MCGIGGILRREPAGSLDDSAARLQRALRHRGPDDRGHYRSPDDVASLVHTRLAILDPSPAGHQPMARGPYRITFNGEIYNFRELREELARQGEIFTTETDTEVLLALYVRHGPECLSRLRGMFAFAIWHEEERSCFLARDPFGIKPLYYGFSREGDFIFASEVKALLATERIERRLDPAGLESFLASGSVAEPLTLIAGVRSLEAGHWMRWHLGVLEICRYFQVDFLDAGNAVPDAAERTRAALTDSVRHHFVSDVPVGIFLSGGLDSGALVALAREAGFDPLATFSIGVEDSARDESAPARRLAEFFGTRHHEMLLTRELARHWADEFFEALDQPTVDGFNSYCVCKLARDHGYKVVLSGIGGDELFGGYPSFQLVPRLLKIGRAVAPWRRLVRPIARGWEHRAKNGWTSRMAAYFQEEPTLPAAYGTVRSIFGPRDRVEVARALLGWEGTDYFHPATTSADPELPHDFSHAVAYLELTRYLRNQLLRDADVMSMAHGLELRVPFVDRQLFGALRALPPATRFQPGKRLLRDAVPSLPRWHAVEHKRGFDLPFGTWLESSWSDLKLDTPRVPSVPLDSWSRQWSLIVLRQWLRRNRFPDEAA